MPARRPSARSVRSGHTMVAIPVARQMTPSTTNSHQFFAMDGTSLIMAATLGPLGMKAPHPAWVTAARTVGWKFSGGDAADRRSCSGDFARAMCSSGIEFAMSTSASRPAESTCEHALGVEDERVRRRRGGAQRLAHAALDVAGVGEEQAVVEPVDDDARRDRARGVHRDVRLAAEPRRPSPARRRAGGRCGGRRRRSRAPTAKRDRLAARRPDHAARWSRRRSRLDAVGAPQRAPGAGVDEPDAAATITAPSTAFGRSAIGPVRNSRTSTTTPAASSPATWLRAPIASLTAVREPLAPTGSPA